MSEHESVEQWENAYLRQCREAAVGRLFRGLIHNLNGVIQAFSMQTELFGMMFDQGEMAIQAIVEELSPSSPAYQRAEKLRELCYKRSAGISLMEDKIRQAQDIMARTLEMSSFQPAGLDKRYTLNTVVRTEMEFLNADRFFKHTVQKEIRLERGMPGLACCQPEFHQVVFALLENAVDALRDTEEPRILIESVNGVETLSLTIEDNGSGIDAEVLPRIFEPFFTTREGKSGLGLYTASRLAVSCGGEISCDSRPGCTAFRLTVPTGRVAA